MNVNDNPKIAMESIGDKADNQIILDTVLIWAKDGIFVGVINHPRGCFKILPPHGDGRNE